VETSHFEFDICKVLCRGNELMLWEYFFAVVFICLFYVKKCLAFPFCGHMLTVSKDNKQAPHNRLHTHTLVTGDSGKVYLVRSTQPI